MPTPTGHWNLPAWYLRNLVAACTTFQTWTATATATLAKARIHRYEIIGPPDSVARPWAMVSMAYPVFDFSQSSSGGQSDGPLQLTFLNDIDTDNTTVDEMDTFMNVVSSIIDEMRSLRNTAPGGDTILAIDRINDERAGPLLVNDDHHPDVPLYIQILLDVTFMNSPV